MELACASERSTAQQKIMIFDVEIAMQVNCPHSMYSLGGSKRSADPMQPADSKVAKRSARFLKSDEVTAEVWFSDLLGAKS